MSHWTDPFNREKEIFHQKAVSMAWGHTYPKKQFYYGTVTLAKTHTDEVVVIDHTFHDQDCLFLSASLDVFCMSQSGVTKVVTKPCIMYSDSGDDADELVFKVVTGQTVNIRTRHFTDVKTAIKYFDTSYPDYGYDEELIQRYIKSGEISIGAPDGYDCSVDVDGRFFILVHTRDYFDN